MRKKSEEKKDLPPEERKASVKKPEPPASEAMADNKAWNLTKQLKSRMDTMHGRGRNGAIAKKKRKFKQMQDLSDGDTTPSDFDPNDSELDSSSEESD